MALDALHVMQVVVPLHQGLVVRVLVTLSRHYAAQLLTSVGLHSHRFRFTNVMAQNSNPGSGVEIADRALRCLSPGLALKFGFKTHGFGEKCQGSSLRKLPCVHLRLQHQFRCC
jgi:hypothetical protein